jgi:hypothetical protein
MGRWNDFLRAGEVIETKDVTIPSSVTEKMLQAQMAKMDKEFMNVMSAGPVTPYGRVVHDGGIGIANTAMSPPNKPAPSLYEMLAMRMRWHGTYPPQFHQVHPVVRGEEVFVLVLPKAGEPVVLTDEAALYPSDKLITTLRVLEGA